ncbi:hypothetical protein [Microcystis sp. BLCC-F210]|uniref:hypothetical protein n=1 Tax=Microcystis sp. BLCC-F210 TaxID=3342751 RepID=UPI0035C907B5
MGKGFAPVLPTGNKAQLKPELPLTSINEIQASLLTYLQDIPDPRVSRLFVTLYAKSTYKMPR